MSSMCIIEAELARRRLFEFYEEDKFYEAVQDNYRNICQESKNQERLEKMRKWNFDFVNEVPLEGTYEWTRCTDGTVDWVGVKSNKNDKIEDSLPMKSDEIFHPMKAGNEVTPKSREDETLQPLRKRRRNDILVTDKAVRRKISFE